MLISGLNGTIYRPMLYVNVQDVRFVYESLTLKMLNNELSETQPV